ncbi:unnamed protein product [Prorocentrum cordatum]|uniref:RNA helicase aquarius N-terminal domain-containing protein n=1 Tax=Prorocentrum cordatum TaxID=2364126 RepID=A0ABN9XS05_9DINO|nr:unnamed protein product [Polarella glacialis]
MTAEGGDEDGEDGERAKAADPFAKAASPFVKAGAPKPAEESSSPYVKARPPRPPGDEAAEEPAEPPVAAPAAAPPGRKPTLRDVLSGEYAAFAKNWSADKANEFQPEVVESIYKNLRSSNFNTSNLMALEFNSYLERYLWPFFEAGKSSTSHLLSIALLVNEKVRDGSVSAWDSIAVHKAKFASYFECMLDLWKGGKASLREKTFLLQFLINCFQSLEQDSVPARSAAEACSRGST